MLLGTFAPKLDDKGRVILPAKFRDEFAGGLVMTRGQERCALRLQPARVRRPARADPQQAPALGKQGRDYLRLFLSGATQEIPDKQHRVTIPPMLREYAGLDRDLTVIGAGNRAEIWDTAAWNDLLRERRSRLLRHRRGGDPRTLLAPRPDSQPRTLTSLPRCQVGADGDQARGARPATPMAENTLHTPVMLERTLELLAPALERPGAVLVDATLGMGGHAEAFLERFPELTLVGLDRDPTRSRSRGSDSRRSATACTSCTPSTTASPRCSTSSASPAVAGILFDLGVSSLQLDQVERGFSYSKDAPLDMRMDDTAELTAARILAEYNEASLRRIFYEYGEEKLAPRYASRIVRGARSRRSRRSAQLVELLDRGDARRPAARRTPGQARLPGAAHRGQPGARRARARDPRRPRRARGRRPHRRARLPVARGPHRQARARRAIHLDRPARPARRAARAPAGVHAARARRRARDRRREGRATRDRPPCACAPPND